MWRSQREKTTIALGLILAGGAIISLTMLGLVLTGVIK